ncbi:hypothetical protein DL768_006875 [Monosporascus sp. mg162]|nr:hypothetical protein DL768_006875 [Monosporascus sp. mg162]
MADITEAAAAPHSTFDLSYRLLNRPPVGESSRALTPRYTSVDHLSAGFRQSNESSNPSTSEITQCIRRDVAMYNQACGPDLDPGWNHFERRLSVDAAIFDLGVPLLDKNVARGEAREYGETDLTIHKVGSSNGVDRLFEGTGDTLQVFMSHFDKLVHLPEGFVRIASTKNTEFAGIAHRSKPIFGIQLHPEISHTDRGTDVLSNFATEICEARPNWEMENFTEKDIIMIRKLIGDKALVASLTTFITYLERPSILVGTGLMRLDECQQVKETLQHYLHINLTIVDGAELFLGRLAGVVEPEAKRKIIGETYITHHNVGGLPARMMNGQVQLKLIEPLREPGIHEDLVIRHPFPGPGIAIRILGKVKPERVDIVRKADHILISLIKEAGIYNQACISGPVKPRLVAKHRGSDGR